MSTVSSNITVRRKLRSLASVETPWATSRHLKRLHPNSGSPSAIPGHSPHSLQSSNSRTHSTCLLDCNKSRNPLVEGCKQHQLHKQKTFPAPLTPSLWNYSTVHGKSKAFCRFIRSGPQMRSQICTFWRALPKTSKSIETRVTGSPLCTEFKKLAGPSNLRLVLCRGHWKWPTRHQHERRVPQGVK